MNWIELGNFDLDRIMRFWCCSILQWCILFIVIILTNIIIIIPKIEGEKERGKKNNNNRGEAFKRILFVDLKIIRMKCFHLKTKARAKEEEEGNHHFYSFDESTYLICRLSIAFIAATVEWTHFCLIVNCRLLLLLLLPLYGLIQAPYIYIYLSFLTWDLSGVSVSVIIILG